MPTTTSTSTLDSSTAPLLSLLPSYTPSSLPPRLLALSASLLSQSRQRAPHLKPEEEIARPYACAEIAVDRLRGALRLPPKKTGARGTRAAGDGGGGPPCKPAVYKKLLGFLSRVLVEKEGGAVAVIGGTPKGGRTRGVGEGGADENENGDENGEEEEDMATPSKRARTGDVETPTKTPARRSAGKVGSGFVGRIKAQKQNTGKSGGQNEEAPLFVMPAIRRLAKVYDTPVMAPHVYTGVCVVLKEANLWPPDPSVGEPEEGFEPDVLALITALYLMVLTKMGKGQMKTRVFNGVSRKAVQLFGAKGLEREESISEWIKRINANGWCKGMDWFESVPGDVFVFQLNAGEQWRGDEEGEDQDDDDEIGDDEGETVGAGMRRAFDIDLDKEDPEGVLLPGLGTMMQASVDWTSDERRRRFEHWKKGIMQKIEAVG